MKAYKKIISFILTLVMMLSLSVNVFAAEPLTDDPNMIEWKYTVFADESLQKVVEEGVIPNAYARYTWRGITLKNGEVAILTPSNNSMGLYCNSGRSRIVANGEIPMIAATSLPPIPFLRYSNQSSLDRLLISTTFSGVYSALLFIPIPPNI